jgi:hypothetical protein
VVGTPRRAWDRLPVCELRGAGAAAASCPVAALLGIFRPARPIRGPITPAAAVSAGSAWSRDAACICLSFLCLRLKHPRPLLFIRSFHKLGFCQALL